MRLVLCVLLVACDCGKSDEAIDAIYTLPSLFVPSDELLAQRDLDRLGDALANINGLGSRDSDAAIVLQNDLWGLLARIERVPQSDARLERLETEVRRALRQVTPDEISQLASPELPLTVRQIAPEVVEAGSEMPVLNHEHHFGLRRIFRVAISLDRSVRVLFSQLVAFDQQGRTRLTSVIGEVEMLRFEGEQLVEARVWHRDRTRSGLAEQSAVTHVPDLGADAFFLREPEPVALADLPCARCHDDDDTMSLPDPQLATDDRWQALLDQVSVPEL